MNSVSTSRSAYRLFPNLHDTRRTPLRYIALLIVTSLLLPIALFAADNDTLSTEMFVACRPGIAQLSSTTISEPGRPLWRAQGFVTRLEAERFQRDGHADAMIVQLTAGALRPWIVVWNTGPFSWDRYLGPTHWPANTYAADELPLALTDAMTHFVHREPWALLGTGDPTWSLLVIYEASGQCDMKRRSAGH
jgi:hypothetical protein